MEKNNPGPSEEVWASFKETIRTLYLGEDESCNDRLPLKDLVQYLKSHGLDTTESQLIKRLHTWNFRYSLPSDAWQYVAHQSAKRKRAGKDTEVYISDVKHCPKKVQRKINRHQSVALISKYQRLLPTPAPSPKTPEGLPLELRTPEALSTPWSQAQALPWLQFRSDSFEYIFSLFTANTDPLHGLVTMASRNKSSFHFGRRQPAVVNDSFWSNLSTNLLQVMPTTDNREEPTVVAVFRNAKTGSHPFEEVVETFLFLVSNNLYDCAEEENWSTVKAVLLPNIANRPLPSNFAQHASGTMSAILEKLFQYSVLWAAKGDDKSLQIVKWLVESGLDPNRIADYDYPYAGYNFPLLVAIMAGQVRLVKLLLQHGADVNWECDIKRGTPLAAACNIPEVSVSRELVGLLLQNGARPHTGDRAKSIPALHYAVRRSHIWAVSLLLKHGANIRCWHEVDEKFDLCRPTFFPSTALSEAASLRLHSIHPDILGEGVESDHGDTALSMVLCILDLSTMSFDIASGQGIDQSLITPEVLISAAAYGNDVVIRFLARCGVSLDVHNKFHLTPLSAAALHQRLKTCKLLLRLGASVAPAHPGFPTPLHLSILGNGFDNAASVDIVKVLASYNASADTRLDPWAIEFSHYQTLCPVDIYNPNYKTPLRSALESGLILCAEYLIEMGVRPNRAETILVVKQGRQSLVRRALEAGANPNADDWIMRLSALQHALVTGNLSIVQLLLDHGALLRGGELAQAFKLGDLKLIQLLLEHGAVADTSPLQQSFLESAACGKQADVFYLALNMEKYTYDTGALCAAVFNACASGNYTFVKDILACRNQKAQSDPLEGTAISMAILSRKRHLLQFLLSRLPIVDQCKVPAREGYPVEQSDGFCSLRWMLGSKYSNQLDIDGIPFWKKEYVITTSPLFAAIHCDEEDILLYLLQAGYKPDRATISYAIFKESKAIPNLLQVFSILPSTIQFAGDPAYWAVEKADISTLRLLQSAGEDICATRSEEEWVRQRTIFQLAVEKGNEEAINMLLEAGADVNESPKGTRGGATALQLAAISGKLSLVQRLITLGAHIHEPGAAIEGRSALQAAAEHGRLDLVQFLLNSYDRSMNTWKPDLLQAAFRAAERGHYAVLEMLRKQEGWGAAEERELKSRVRCDTSQQGSKYAHESFWKKYLHLYDLDTDLSGEGESDDGNEEESDDGSEDDV